MRIVSRVSAPIATAPAASAASQAARAAVGAREQERPERSRVPALAGRCERALEQGALARHDGDSGARRQAVALERRREVVHGDRLAGAHVRLVAFAHDPGVRERLALGGERERVLAVTDRKRVRCRS